MKHKYEIAVVSKGGFARTLRIFAPKKADRAIIMHDGQNVFRDDDATYKKSWRALDALKTLGITNTAIIGIDSTATRYDDYIPFPTELEKYGVKPSGGKAEIYCDYIEHRIIPYLDGKYGFKFYGILGSSAGGLATLAIAARNIARIRAYGIYSAPLFVCPDAFSKFFDNSSFDAQAFYHIYAGGSETTGTFNDRMMTAAESDLFVQDAFTIVTQLRKSGAKNLLLDIDNTAGHDETFWRAPEKTFFREFSELQ